MSLQWQGTVMEAGHGVDHDQFEPGVPDAQQAHEHLLDIVLMDWRLGVALGVTSWLELELGLPVRLIAIDAGFRDAAGEDLPDFESIHHRDENLFGVGDLSLIGRFRLIKPMDVPGLRLDVRAGASFPTGNTEPDPFALGRRGLEHQHMFFGSGTVDPIAGLDLGYALSDLDLSFAGYSAVRASVYENTHGYQAPTQVTGGLNVATGFGLETWRFFLGPEVFHETVGEWSGVPANNSGRTDVIAMAGAQWLVDPSWSLQALARVPFTVRSEGGQLDIPFVGMLGVTYALSLWGDDE